MSRYDSIVIIYNPNSTGGSQAIAHELSQLLKEQYGKGIIKLRATKYRGHAEVLAYEAAVKTKKPLIISVSGDGGYHEVVNGIMKAKQEGAEPVVGLMAAGNANDHFHALHGTSTWDAVDSITHGHERTIDVLRLETRMRGKPVTRYAHSYIGLGLTPHAGHQLNQTQLNRINEIWIVAKAAFSFPPVRIIRQGIMRRYDSITFSTVPRMSKIVQLSHDAQLDDGKYEIGRVVHRSRWHLIMRFIKATTSGLDTIEAEEPFEFKTKGKPLIQLDGEIARLDRRSKAVISILPHALRCLR